MLTSLELLVFERSNVETWLNSAGLGDWEEPGRVGPAVVGVTQAIFFQHGVLAHGRVLAQVAAVLSHLHLLPLLLIDENKVFVALELAKWGRLMMRFDLTLARAGVLCREGAAISPRGCWVEVRGRLGPGGRFTVLAERISGI